MTLAYRPVDWNALLGAEPPDRDDNRTDLDANASGGDPVINCPQREAEEASGPLDMSACTCSGTGTRGFEAWFAITAEQIEATWCEVGAMASVGLGLLLYYSHGLAWSHMRSQALHYAQEVHEHERKERLTMRRRNSKNSGAFVIDPEKTREKLEISGYFKVETENDPLPRPADHADHPSGAKLRVWHV
jgi:hypothetical protein